MLLWCRTSVEGRACAALRQREDDALAGHDLDDLGALVQVLHSPGVGGAATIEGVKLRLLTSSSNA